VECGRISVRTSFVGWDPHEINFRVRFSVPHALLLGRARLGEAMRCLCSTLGALGKRPKPGPAKSTEKASRLLYVESGTPYRQYRKRQVKTLLHDPPL
jgi:hypothetical protein